MYNLRKPLFYYSLTITLTSHTFLLHTTPTNKQTQTNTNKHKQTQTNTNKHKQTQTNTNKQVLVCIYVRRSSNPVCCRRMSELMHTIAGATGGAFSLALT